MAMMSHPSMVGGALMACAESSTAVYAGNIRTYRETCLCILDDYERNGPDNLYAPDDGRRFRKPSNNLGLQAMYLAKQVNYVKTKPEKPIFPLSYTRLSDELVYLATKHLSPTDRARKYPYDFNSDGDIDTARVPSGVSPICWAHGLPFFPVYKGYYILCGRLHARWAGWILHPLGSPQAKSYPTWTVGPVVVAPGSAVALIRKLNNQMQIWDRSKGLPGVNYPRAFGLEADPAMRDRVASNHTDIALVPSVNGGYTLCALVWIRGYHPRCGPSLRYYPNHSIAPATVFHGIPLDYQQYLHRRYFNQRHPSVYETVGNQDANETWVFQPAANTDPEIARYETESTPDDTTIATASTHSASTSVSSESETRTESESETSSSSESGSDSPIQHAPPPHIQEPQQLQGTQHIQDQPQQFSQNPMQNPQRIQNLLPYFQGFQYNPGLPYHFPSLQGLPLYIQPLAQYFPGFPPQIQGMLQIQGPPQYFLYSPGFPQTIQVVPRPIQNHHMQPAHGLPPIENQPPQRIEEPEQSFFDRSLEQLQDQPAQPTQGVLELTEDHPMEPTEDSRFFQDETLQTTQPLPQRVSGTMLNIDVAGQLPHFNYPLPEPHFNLSNPILGHPPQYVQDDRLQQIVNKSSGLAYHLEYITDDRGRSTAVYTQIHKA
ncbi:hypothetical protein N7495_008277 [Penicillium taxi]|uniref:uncharacterized protein n=1 Tax=Penicillium taxi TaxID=168475 RepID=UPI002544EE4B|nr:uncharacterized protein N7495_008277 [Penicillium taxi]KAJ5888236.1 hypothetical protein N7495_008277 [Penicillium taxi]